MTCSQLGDSSLQSLIGFLIGGMIGLNHRDEFPMGLQEIGFFGDGHQSSPNLINP